jgi:hypothetical protein
MMSDLHDLIAEAPLKVLQRALAAPSGAGSVASLLADLAVANPRLAAAHATQSEKASPVCEITTKSAG